MADYQGVPIGLNDEDSIASLAFANAARQISGLLKGNGQGGVLAQEVDAAPTAGSQKLVTSGATYTAVHATKSISEGGTGQTTAPKALYALGNGSAAITAENVADNDYFPLLDTSANTGKKMLVSEAKKLLGGGLLPQLTVTILNGPATSVTAALDAKTVTLVYDSASDVWTGELGAFGTWVVTAVDADGETVSDTVEVAAVQAYVLSLNMGNLPSGYTRLEYIGLSGAQYINTGLESGTTYIVDGGFMITVMNTSKEQFLYGAANGSSQTQTRENACWIDTRSGSGGLRKAMEFYLPASAGYDYATTAGGTMSQDVQYTYRVDPVTPSLTLNGVDTKIDFRGTADGYPSGYQIYLGATNRSGADYYLTGRLYEHTFLLDNGSIAANFVPAKRDSDGVIGMYDVARNAFYTNAGSGSFTAGPEA